MDIVLVSVVVPRSLVIGIGSVKLLQNGLCFIAIVAGHIFDVLADYQSSKCLSTARGHFLEFYFPVECSLEQVFQQQLCEVRQQAISDKVEQCVPVIVAHKLIANQCAAVLYEILLDETIGQLEQIQRLLERAEIGQHLEVEKANILQEKGAGVGVDFDFVRFQPVLRQSSSHILRALAQHFFVDSDSSAAGEDEGEISV